MADTSNKNSAIVSKRRNQRGFRRILAPLACLVAIIMGVSLMVPAVSMTRGELVCGMEEHAHSKACYEQVLVCGMEEGEGAKPATDDEPAVEGHKHTKDCYEKQLVCGKPEHKHVDSCYAAPEPDSEPANLEGVDSDASASENGRNVGEYAGQSVDIDDDSNSGQTDNQDENANLDEGESVDSVTGEGTTQSFEADLKDKDGKSVLTVNVEAPKDALPEGAWMKIDGVDAKKVWDPVQSAVKRAAAGDADMQKAMERAGATDEIALMTVVDIVFRDAEGNVVEPVKKLKVRITSDMVRDMPHPAHPFLARVSGDRDAKDDAKRYADAEMVLKKVKVANRDAADESEGAEDTVAFKADKFGPYAIMQLADAEGADKVVEEGDSPEADEPAGFDSPAMSFERDVTDADGKVVLKVSAEVPENTLPEGADMHAGLVEDEKVLDAAKEAAAGEAEIAADRAEALAVDITFVDAEGNAIEPAGDVHVTMSAPAVAEQDQLAVVHVDDAANAQVVQGEDVNKAEQTVAFDANAFSAYVLVYAIVGEYTLSDSGETYVVTIRYGADAHIPSGSELRVKEILPGDEEYANAQQKIERNLAEGKEDIPSNPALFDISIWCDGQEIEPAEGSEVQVEIKLVDDSLKGRYSDEDSPLLINDQPVADEKSEMEKQVQVLHLVDDAQVASMKTTDKITDEEVMSSFTTDSFSNWLLFLDEDLSSINITTGDSLTLRPYTEWVWKQDAELDNYKGAEWDFPASDWDVRTSREWVNNQWVDFTYYTHKQNRTIFRSFQKEDTQLGETYTVVTSQEIHEGSFDLRVVKNGALIKDIHVNVTQGDGNQKPETVGGVEGLKVNLFDYDVPGSGSSYDFTKSGNLDVSSNVASNPDNSDGLNNNHDLKFLGYGGSNATQAREWFWINDYTKDVPSQGIVKNELDEDGYPELGPSTQGVERSNPELKYLFDPESKNHDVYAFPGADGLFQQDNHGFYYYNSNVNYAEYDRNSNSFTLYEHTYSQNTGGSNGANAKPIGFFPFHEYDTVDTQSEMNFNSNLNHHFGMSMSVDFEIPKDKKAEFNGEKYDIIYEFSGDDDLWVFIDDELVLDIGGVHQPVTGQINFTTGEITVYGKNKVTKTFSVGAHTMKMFYIERGGCDSNLSVKFNLPLVKGKAAFDIAKKSLATDATNSDAFLAGAVFGVWENETCSGEPYMTATSDANGHVDFGYLPVKQAGQKFYIKEIAPPDGYLLNMGIFTATASEADADGNYTLTVTDASGAVVEKMDQEPKYPIIRDDRPNPINLSVEKKWQNADGTPMTPPSDVTAEFEVLRYITKVKVSEPEETVTVIIRNNANPSKEFDRTTAHFDDVLTINYRHSPDGNNHANCNAGNGVQNILYMPSNSTGAATDVTYTVNRNHVGSNGTIEIVAPSWFTDWCDPSGNYSQGVLPHFTGSSSGGGDESPAIESETYFDETYSYPLNLPNNGSWTNTATNLPTMTSDAEYDYYYSYFIKEKTVPDGFEAVYYDGQGHQITDSSSQATNTTGNTQTIANRQLMDVPVMKDWADFSGDEFTWTADFQLEQRELKVNPSDPDASDAIAQWEPIDGKTLRVTKGQTPTPAFTGLPKFRMHSNGTLYRILYSVAETAYEVKENGVVVAKWDDEHGHTIGHRYTPQFIQDAGGNEQGEQSYEIKLANTLHKPTVTNDIDLKLEKKWTLGGQEYNPGNGASATFVLKRYVHEEYRNYSHVEDMTDLVTITLDVQGTGTNPIITVPRGAMVSIEGNILAKQNATIEFQRANGSLLSKVIDNSSSDSLKPFDITFEATDDETITLHRGDNYVSGGREGFRLTDYGDQSVAKEDKHFSQEFMLPIDGSWIKQLNDLPQVEEDEMDEVSHVQTITVYTYYFEEVSCDPAGFHPVFKATNGHVLGDLNNPVDISQDLVAENQADVGSLKLKKLVRVNEFDPLGEHVLEADKTKADGTYSFTIVGKEETRTQGQSHTVTITVDQGEVSSATVDGSAAQVGSDGTVLVTGLVTGQYIVTEEENPNTVCIGVLCTDPTAITDEANRTVEITISVDEPDVEPKQVQYTNNYASSGEDIAHVSVRKTFVGLRSSEIPQDFKVNVTVTATIDGEQKVFTYTLTGGANQDDGVTHTTTTDANGNPVWNWRIAIAGLKPDAQLNVVEDKYEVAGYDVSTSTNGTPNTDAYNGVVSADTVIQDFNVDIITANNRLTFPLNDTGDTAKIFMARLTSDQTTLVISKNRLTLSEKAKIEAKLKQMAIAGDWTHGGNDVLYYNFEEAGSDQIKVKGRTVTYSAENGGQITFSHKCQWSMTGTGNITYVPGRPADVNFVNSYTENKIELDIIKVDKSSSEIKLPGAVFTLRKLSGPIEHPDDPPVPLPSGEFSGEVIGDSAPTAENTGKTTFGNLTKGYYEITEKTPPAGYVLKDASPIYFKVESGTVIRVEWSKEQSKWIEKSNDEMVSFTEAQIASGDNPASNAAFTVGNTPGAALPLTGGSGTVPYTLLGMALSFIAGVWIIAIRWRRKTDA